jgi:hypothetical protein
MNVGFFCLQMRKKITLIMLSKFCRGHIGAYRVSDEHWIDPELSHESAIYKRLMAGFWPVGRMQIGC